MAEIDWEKRARELWGGAVCRFPREGTVEVERIALGRAMLQLGREMAEGAKNERLSAISLLRDMAELARHHGKELTELVIPRWLSGRLDIEAHKDRRSAARTAGEYEPPLLPVSSFYGCEVKIAEDLAELARTDEREKAALAQAKLDANELKKAADERAEEIAKMLDGRRVDAESFYGTVSIGEIGGLKAAASIARSTITKPVVDRPGPATAREVAAAADPLGAFEYPGPSEESIRADEREKIADMIQGAARGHSTPHWLEACDHFARLLRKPKTREAVLEEALRELADLGRSHDKFCECGWCDARRALEWKPL